MSSSSSNHNNLNHNNNNNNNSKPPHSTAYPDIGGPGNIQPFGQLIRGLHNPNPSPGSGPQQPPLQHHSSSSSSSVIGGSGGGGAGSAGAMSAPRSGNPGMDGGGAGRSFSSPQGGQNQLHRQSQSSSSGGVAGQGQGQNYNHPHPHPHPSVGNGQIPSPLSHLEGSGSGLSNRRVSIHMSSRDDALSHAQSHSPDAMSIEGGEGLSEEDVSDGDIASPDVVGGTGSKRKRSGHDVGGKGGGKSSKSSGVGGFGKGGSSTNTLTTGGKEKRKRQVQSCSECRRRKIKCDKKFPCGPCVLRNDQSICREVEKHTPTSTGCASSQDLLQVQYRLAALESVLAQAGILPAGALDEMLGGKGKLSFMNAGGVIGPETVVDSEGIQNRLRKIARGVGMADDDDEESDTEGAALTLEHLAFGRRRTQNPATVPHAVGYIPDDGQNNVGPATGVTYFPGTGGKSIKVEDSGPNAHGFQGRLGSVLDPSNRTDRVPEELMPNRPLKLYGEVHGPVMTTALDALEPGEVFSIFYQRSDVFVKALLSVMPDRRRGELLVKTYIERVEWVHRCLHVPTFLHQCQELWDTPLEYVVPNVYTPFLSLYMIVLCLGLYFMEQTEAAEYFTPEEIESLPGIWLTASRGSLWMGDFMANHTIEHLQSLVLIGIFLNNRDRADAAWSLLGATIKMAQNMGLSRLGSEGEATPDSPAPNWKAPWQSLIKRETGRRLWWNLVFLDWSLAPSYNYASSIQPDQIKTALPANVNDEDVVEGQPLIAKPLSERTGMSYHLARLRFAEISQRQIWQANASPHPPYSFILSVDTELRKAMADLPTHFSIDLDAPLPPPTDVQARVEYWEKIIINLSGQSRLLRLHRPWLSRGYKDKKYDYSREQCIRAARTSLKLMSDQWGTAAFLERWWIPLFYVTVAAVVLLIDLLRATRDELNGEEAMEKRKEIENALAAIKQCQSWSAPARGSARVIGYLLDELDNRRAGNTILDPLSATDVEGSHAGLQKVVKRFMMEGTSPPSQHTATTPNTTSSHRDGSPVDNARRGVQQHPNGQTYQSLFPHSAPPAVQGPSGSQQPSQLYGNTAYPDPNTTAGFQGLGFQDQQNAMFGSFVNQMSGNGSQDIDLESMLAAYMPTQNQSQAGNNNGGDMFGSMGMQNWTWDNPNPQMPGTGQSMGPIIDNSGELQNDLFSQNNPYRGWMG